MLPFLKKKPTTGYPKSFAEEKTYNRLSEVLCQTTHMAYHAEDDHHHDYPCISPFFVNLWNRESRCI